MINKQSSTLTDLVKGHKDGNEECTLEIIKKFEPLMYKYARKIEFEDTFSDLTESLLIALNKIPLFSNEGQAVQYISTSIKNGFYKALKQNSKYSGHLIFDIVCFDIGQFPNQMDINHIALMDAIKNLNEMEREIIMSIYFYGSSNNDMAKQYNVSRQTIHSVKRKAFNKLKADMIA